MPSGDSRASLRKGSSAADLPPVQSRLFKTPSVLPAIFELLCLTRDPPLHQKALEMQKRGPIYGGKRRKAQA